MSPPIAGAPAVTRSRRRDWEFYMAFNMFRLAGILQGIMARALQGNASSAEAVEAGRRARPLAEEAWRQVERLLAEH
jgi:aminoglycoside phosphotransferase (APT) family kinase protein